MDIPEILAHPDIMGFYMMPTSTEGRFSKPDVDITTIAITIAHS